MESVAFDLEATDQPPDGPGSEEWGLVAQVFMQSVEDLLAVTPKTLAKARQKSRPAEMRVAAAEEAAGWFFSPHTSRRCPASACNRGGTWVSPLPCRAWKDGGICPCLTFAGCCLILGLDPSAVRVRLTALLKLKGLVTVA